GAALDAGPETDAEPAAALEPAVPASKRRAEATPSRGAARAPTTGLAPPIVPSTTPAALEPASSPTVGTAAPSGGLDGIRLADIDDWHALLDSGAFKGPAKLLAEHAGFLGFHAGVLRLSLHASDEHLRTGPSVRMLGNALAIALGTEPQLRFEAGTEAVESVRDRNERVRDERQSQAEATFMADPDVQRLITRHGARLVPDSIRPLDGA
ncbi:DNA polymerase III subunit gamma/tau C-terminal domain-containing protein, partial [Lysobacter sp. A3-1-A15]